MVGVAIPSRLVHAALGPALVVLNGVLLVYVRALVGYAFLTILRWLGMYAFLSSIGLDENSTGPWFFGRQTLITVM